MSPDSPAGLLRRLAAITYDCLIVGALVILATMATMPFTRGNAIPAGTLWFQLYLVVLMIAYFAGFWRFGGQTIGMVAWRLQLVATNGAPVTLPQAIWRALVAPVSWLAVGLGFWWVLLDNEKRSWHDWFSRSRLVMKKTITARAPTPPA